MNKLKSTEKAYIAGLLDGEGCVGIRRDKKKLKSDFKYYYSVRAIISNSNYEVIQWLKLITGIGCAYMSRPKEGHPKWKPVHRYQVVSQCAIDFLNGIKKYCIIKRPVIDAALKFEPNKQGHDIRSEIYNKQTALFYELKNMNVRGAIHQ